MPTDAEERLQMRAENQKMLSATDQDLTSDGCVFIGTNAGRVELTKGGLTVKLLSWRDIC